MKIREIGVDSKNSYYLDFIARNLILENATAFEF